MKESLIRVGTMYIPVSNVEQSTEWYMNNLGAELSYKDQDKAILNFANQSFFLVNSLENQTANFIDYYGHERFSVTFEVNGLQALETLHESFIQKGMKVGEIEDRGHTGRNFVFYDLDNNQFDVWSELSPVYKQFFQLENSEATGATYTDVCSFCNRSRADIGELAVGPGVSICKDCLEFAKEVLKSHQNN